MLFEKFCAEKQLSESTIGFYKSAIQLYEEINKNTMDNLIEEADNEEKERIRWKERTLLSRLVDFRTYLFSNKSESTAKRYFSAIKTFYNHNLIEIHDLPSFNTKCVDKTHVLKHDELLTKEELVNAYYEATNNITDVLLLGISSGLAKVDMLNLTVEDLVCACESYFELIDEKFKREYTLLDTLLKLKEYDVIIPCFEGNRQKTTSEYVTFASPEFVDHVLQHLIGRDAKLKEEHNQELKYNDKLLDVTGRHVQYSLSKINDVLEYGKAGHYNRLRTHMFRKFHASTLLNTEIVSWSVEEIDTLQGRSMDMTHRAYFMNSKEKLFKKYFECVDELMLFRQIHAIDKETVEKLESENNYYKTEIVKNEQKMEEQQRTIDEIKKQQEKLEAMLQGL